MKKLTLILSAVILLSSCSSMFMSMSSTKKTESLPPAVSDDPYKGEGTSEDYMTLARNYEIKSYQYASKAVSCWENAREAKSKTWMVSDYSRKLSYMQKYLNYQTKAESYKKKSRQMTAEQYKYLALSKTTQR